MPSLVLTAALVQGGSHLLSKHHQVAHPTPTFIHLKYPATGLLVLQTRPALPTGIGTLEFDGARSISVYNHISCCVAQDMCMYILVCALF